MDRSHQHMGNEEEPMSDLTHIETHHGHGVHTKAPSAGDDQHVHDAQHRHWRWLKAGCALCCRKLANHAWAPCTVFVEAQVTHMNRTNPWVDRSFA